MSISAEISKETTNYLYIPCNSRMVHTQVDRKNIALCYIISVGYFDTCSYSEMQDLLVNCQKSVDMEPYGPCDKVKKGRIIHYRQRIRFTDLMCLCEFCKQNGVHIALTSDFKVTIDSLNDCHAELKYLRKYAKLHKQNLDTYLTNTCKLQFYTLLQSKHIKLENEKDYYHILKGHEGYMERAPFLLSKYNMANTTSALFIPNMRLPKSMYNKSKPSFTLNYGYTAKMVEHDRKAGVFE